MSRTRLFSFCLSRSLFLYLPVYSLCIQRKDTLHVSWSEVTRETNGSIFIRSHNENTVARNRRKKYSSLAQSGFWLHTNECFSRLEWISSCDCGRHNIRSLLSSKNIHSNIQVGEVFLCERKVAPSRMTRWSVHFSSKFLFQEIQGVSMPEEHMSNSGYSYCFVLWTGIFQLSTLNMYTHILRI